MIRIDDNSCGFVGTNSDLNGEYSQLTSRFLEAKVDGGIPFQDAVEEIITAAQFAVEYQINNKGNSLDWDAIKKAHTETRLATALYHLMGDEGPELLKKIVKLVNEDAEGEEEEDNG